jgi:hypothetical protein
METETLTQHDKRATNIHIQRALARARDLGLAVYNSPDYFALDDADATSQIENWATEGREHRPDDAGRRQSMGPSFLGSIDSPAEGFQWSGGMMEVSGWALSAGGVRALHIKRAPLPGDAASRIGTDGLVDLGIARFHNGTRADVVTAYPDWPHNYRAGWSYSLARSAIPPMEKGQLSIRAVAVDRSGDCAVVGARVVRLGKISSPGSDIRCRKPFDSMYIDAHGYAYPYSDCHTDVPFGSLVTDTLREIWEGRRFAALRHELVAGRSTMMCRRCPLFINRAVDDSALFEAHADFSRENRR